MLVNNAGISSRGTVESTDEALWDQTMSVNLKGAWLGIKAALPLLRRRQGTILNIGSTRATRPDARPLPLRHEQGGLWGLTRQVAVECLLEGVTCNMVAPGWVDTPGERMIQAALRPARVPRRRPEPDHRRTRSAPRSSTWRRPPAERSTASSFISTPACTSPTTPGWSTCPNDVRAFAITSPRRASLGLRSRRREPTP